MKENIHPKPSTFEIIDGALKPTRSNFHHNPDDFWGFAFDHLSHISSLDFSGIHMMLHAVTNIVNLLSYDNNITHLNLANTGINADTLTMLGTALTSDSNHITSLDLTSLFNTIGEKELKILAAILSHSSCQISHLNLSCNNLQGSKMGVLRDFFTNPHNKQKITDINLRNTKLEPIEVEMLIDILTYSNNTFTHLDLRNNNLSLNLIRGLMITLENKDIKIEISSNININDYAIIIQGNPNIVIENNIVAPLYNALMQCENEYDRSQVIINFSRNDPDSMQKHIEALLNNPQHFTFNLHEVDEYSYSLLHYHRNESIRNLLITHGAELSDIEEHESDSNSNEDLGSLWWDYI